MTKLKAFADDKLNVDEMTISLRDRVESTVGKEENAGYQHFLLFPQCFPKPSSLGSFKDRFCGRVKSITKEKVRFRGFRGPLSAKMNCRPEQKFPLQILVVYSLLCKQVIL